MVHSNHFEKVGSQLNELRRHLQLSANNEAKIFEKLNFLEGDIKKMNFTIAKRQKEILKIVRMKSKMAKDLKTPSIKLVNSNDIEAKNAEILVLVTSHIAHRNRRDSIRVNWGDLCKFAKYGRQYNSKATYKVYFITGYLQSEIERARIESALHKDMLIMNRTEDYWDLSRRVMFGFLWSLENCKFDYLLKTDDDVFVNIPNLFKWIFVNQFE